tara:strand:+ start:63 stop:716 length:654 start_codon:yes stop_codon:yes gene_type:complete
MIKENIDKFISKIPENVKLIAISKTKSVDEILEAYNQGQRIFGENKIQEMTEKYNLLPKDIKWHMVGHVQRNKIKYMAPYVDLIHGIDSFKSLKTINKEGEKNNRIIKCLLQLKISSESTKFGLEIDEIEKIINSKDYKELTHTKICGIMAMASFTKDKNIIKDEFNSANKLYNQIKGNDDNFEILSMGMSNDYELAIECGSNMVRIGSSIFGSRNY